MTAYDYALIAATAARLLTRFGRALVLRSKIRIAGDDWDPVHGQVDVPVIGVVTPYTLAERGDLIPAGDEKAILTGSATPDVGQKLVDGDIEMEIVNVEKIAPGDTTLIWICQGRR